jgi:hypothetical protein
VYEIEHKVDQIFSNRNPGHGKMEKIFLCALLKEKKNEKPLGTCQLIKFQLMLNTQERR